MSLIDKLFGNNHNQPSPSQTEDSALQQAGENKVDVNKPVENPRLKKLFEQWEQHRTDDLLNQVFEEIAMRAHFLFVIMLSEEPESCGNGTVIFRQETTMQFPMLTTQDGKSFYPAFTDWEEVAKWQYITSPPKTLILSFDDYAAMVTKKEGSDGVVINPFGDSFVLNIPLIKHLKTQKDIITKGVSVVTAEKNTKILIGEPNEYPWEMATAISDYLKQQPLVRRAWLRLMTRDNELSYLLIVDFSGDTDKLFRGIAAAARPHIKNIYLDMIPYQDNTGKTAAEGAEPFYNSYKEE